MQVTDIQETIKVRADFAAGRIIPLRLRRGNQVHTVREVHARWSDREGENRLLFFSVSLDTGDVAQIYLSTRDMVWWWENVSTV